MQAAQRAVANALAGFDGRTAESWHRRAWEATKDAGPLEEADDRMLAFLEERYKDTRERALEREAFKIRLDVYRRSRSLPSEEVMRPARERVLREGGISHGHATSLGYESVAELGS